MKYIILSLLFFSSPSFCGSIQDAAYSGNVNALAMLLGVQPSLLEDRSTLQQTPLLEAIRGLQPEAVEFLLKKGADPQACNINEENGFHVLIIRAIAQLQTELNPGYGIETKQQTHDDIVSIGQLLIKAEVSLTKRDVEGQTPFDLAGAGCCYPLFPLLKTHMGQNFSKISLRIKNEKLAEEAIKTLLRLRVKPQGSYDSIFDRKITLIEAALEKRYVWVIYCLLAINAPITDFGLQKLVSNYAREDSTASQKDADKDFLVTALASFKLRQNKEAITKITAMIPPKELQQLQPEVDVKANRIVTDPLLLTHPIFRPFFLPRQRIEAQRRGLSLERYLQYTRR